MWLVVRLCQATAEVVVLPGKLQAELRAVRSQLVDGEGTAEVGQRTSGEEPAGAEAGDDLLVDVGDVLVDLVPPEHFPAHEAPDVERLHLHPVDGLQGAVQVCRLTETATHLRDLASPACDP